MKKKNIYSHEGLRGYLFSIILAVTLVLPWQVFAGQNNAEISLSLNGISAVSHLQQITYMELRIVDPSGQLVFEQRTDGSPIAWNISSDAIDGHYSYELRFGESAKRTTREGAQQRGKKSKAIVESGGFLINNGAIVQHSGEETGLIQDILSLGGYAISQVLDLIVTPAFADQVILDDLIVDGSTCVGQDCVNGESFGFDTIRLKENNLRIHFDDTSSTSSFPSNDWRITINDSSNGGTSYFGVEDSTAGRRVFTLEAGAPAHSLYVNSSGRVGIGTSVPLTELHIADGDTPTLRLDQDGTSGWSPQVWDIAGNETNFFVRDVTNGSKLPFRIKPNTPENTLFLKENGNVGIGTDAPTQKLHVVGNAFISGNLELGSSREVKNNIESLQTEEAMQTFAKLRPVKFQYKVAPEEESVGFIAEEVPSLVATNSRKSISTMDVVAVLTKVVQEQQKAIDELNKTITELNTKIDNTRAVHPVLAVQ